MDRPPLRLVVDTDMGCDDAIALLMAALAPGVELEAVTVVAGSVPVERAVRGALAVLALAGRPDVPVHAGAARPLARELVTAPEVHGADGLGGAPVPASEGAPSPIPAADALRRLAAEAPRRLALVALGPLTNVATALAAEPGLLTGFARVCAMGGAPDGIGNAGPFAEYNLWADPDAADAVLTAGVPVTLVGLDVARRAAVLSARERRLLAGSPHPAGRLAARLAGGLAERLAAFGADAACLSDPLAMAVAIAPELVTGVERGRASVVRSDRGRGMLRLREDPAGVVEVVADVDAAGFRRLLLASLGATLPAPA